LNEVSNIQDADIAGVTIKGGHGRNGKPEPVRQVKLKMGDVVSIVGPTGSGKTTLINDIELLANTNTPTGRQILINGETPQAIYRKDPAHNPIALITQHTNFLSDLPVFKFLETHARIQEVAPKVAIREVNALYGIGIDPILEEIKAAPEVADVMAGGQLFLRGNPPVGTCTICVGKKEVGWQSHFGVVRSLENQNFYRGQ